VSRRMWALAGAEAHPGPRPGPKPVHTGAVTYAGTGAGMLDAWLNPPANTLGEVS